MPDATASAVPALELSSALTKFTAAGVAHALVFS